MQELSDLRKQKGLRQIDIAEKIGMSQSTFAYKESMGTFTEAEKSAIAKHLKTDVQYIVWTKTSTGKVPDEKDRIIREKEEEIIQLKAQVKTLQEMIDRFMQKR